MTTVAAAPEQARRSAQSAVETLRKKVVDFLDSEGGSAPLHDLVRVLRESGAPDELISRAVAGMLSNDSLRLTSQRNVTLTEGH